MDWNFWRDCYIITECPNGEAADRFWVQEQPWMNKCMQYSYTIIKFTDHIEKFYRITELTLGPMSIVTDASHHWLSLLQKLTVLKSSGQRHQQFEHALSWNIVTWYNFSRQKFKNIKWVRFQIPSHISPTEYRGNKKKPKRAKLMAVLAHILVYSATQANWATLCKCTQQRMSLSLTVYRNWSFAQDHGSCAGDAQCMCTFTVILAWHMCMPDSKTLITSQFTFYLIEMLTDDRAKQMHKGPHGSTPCSDRDRGVHILQMVLHVRLSANNKEIVIKKK